MEQFKFESKQEANYEYLKEQLKYLGFGDPKLHEPLKHAMSKDMASFTLEMNADRKALNGQKIVYDLNFSRSTEKDLYSLNSFKLNFWDKNNEISNSNSFFVKHTKGITAKEALNLMEGRSVFKHMTNKTGENVDAWIKINPTEKDTYGSYKYKMFNQGYGFNLEDELNKLPIKELKDEISKERLIKSLEKGNLQSVTYYLENGNEQKRFIAAEPQFKKIEQFTESYNRIFSNKSDQFEEVKFHESQSNIWASELSTRTAISKGMTLSEIDEKQAMHYNLYELKAKELGADIVPDLANGEEFVLNNKDVSLNHSSQTNEERFATRFEEEMNDTRSGFSFEDGINNLDEFSKKMTEKGYDGNFRTEDNKATPKLKR